ncbi:MAG: hypothetical protein AAGU04_02325 [Anaerolineaceae bacterium]
MALPSNPIQDKQWKNLQITPEDLQTLSAHLFEKESPLSIDGLARVLISNRLESARADLKRKQDELGKIYLPKDLHEAGERIVFPQRSWESGTVTASHQGNNPEIGDFTVMTVAFADGSTREYAAGVADHALNAVDYEAATNGESAQEAIWQQFGSEIKAKLRAALENQTDLVRIGYTWFPKSLLIDIGPGHLNLAEALLDARDGGPMSSSELMNQLELSNGENDKLMEFSLNYELQEDPRFDEVGTTGEIAWFLKKLEPQSVLETPLYLRVPTRAASLEELSEDTDKILLSTSDELYQSRILGTTETSASEAAVVLNFPHWRSGTLPINAETARIFPSALETEHVKFSLMDSSSGELISAWVVRKQNYVYGLREWYEAQNLIPGSIVVLKATDNPAVVKINPQKKRSNKEWIKTVLVGADGGLVIALLRQAIYAGFHDRMAIAIPDLSTIDKLWEDRKAKNISLKSDVMRMMNELSKLNTQRHVHYLDLYAAINVIRRTPPLDLLSVLATSDEFKHVGDHYYHLAESE